jgi:peroxiredoxin Q/BCP
MAQLRQDYKEFVVRNAEVLIVSPEDEAQVVSFWEKERMPMPGLVDPGHEVANQYGQKVSLLQMGRLPTLLVLDRSGAVRYEHRGSNMMDIPQNKQLLALLDELNREWEAKPSGERVKE